jgi:hypothetical protein
MSPDVSLAVATATKPAWLLSSSPLLSMPFVAALANPIMVTITVTVVVVVVVVVVLPVATYS